MITTALTDQTTTRDAEAGPEQIMGLASGFMVAKHLFAASELGVFEALADGPATLDALASRTGLTRRAARISADAMVALGLLERSGEHYRNGAAAARFLSGGGPADLRPFLRFWDRISYRTWESLAEALARGPTHEIFALEEPEQQTASAGIEAIQAGTAYALPSVVDLAQRRRLLDVGGGTGLWTIALVRHYPQLTATVLDLPVVADLARARVADAGLDGRVAVTAADALVDDLPEGHDAFLVANLAHYWSPETNITLLRRVRRVAEPGARLLLADFWTDPTHTEPLQAALMAGEFAVHLKEGDVYSVEEVRSWLPEAGWRFVDHRPLLGPQSVVVADAD